MKHLMIIFSLFAALFVAACDEDKDAKEYTVSPSGWYHGPVIDNVPYMRGVGRWPMATPLGEFEFTFPEDENGAVKYITRRTNYIGNAKGIEFTYRFNTRDATLVALNGGTAITSPPTVSPYFATADNDWKTHHRRWWGTPTVLEDTGNEYKTVRVMFDDFDQWVSVRGKLPTDTPADLQNALNKASQIGLTFGSNPFRGHGVREEPSRVGWDARFVLHSYKVIYDEM